MLRLKILFLTPYPLDVVASQRFRFEQYLSILRTKHVCDMHSFYSFRTFSILYKNGHNTEKLFGFLGGYLKSLLVLARVKNYDLVLIHREVTPLGPPWVEWAISKLLAKPIIYDFDDAIWLPDEMTKSKPLLNTLKYPGKVKYICRWSYKISCGNPYLANYARQYNSNVSVTPTTIDTTNYHIPRKHRNRRLVIGWTGSHTTLPYLNGIVPVLKILREKFDFIFKVICNKQPDFDFPGLQFTQWNKEGEINELNTIDIGIMPLPDTPWTRGKCGFKILQYMALEKATLASPVGVNNEIIDHGNNGFLCTNQNEWLNCLEKLIKDEGLRRKLGQNGRIMVQQRYSTDAHADGFMSLFS